MASAGSGGRGCGSRQISPGRAATGGGPNAWARPAATAALTQEKAMITPHSTHTGNPRPLPFHSLDAYGVALDLVRPNLSLSKGIRADPVSG